MGQTWHGSRRSQRAAGELLRWLGIEPEASGGTLVLYTSHYPLGLVVSNALYVGSLLASSYFLQKEHPILFVAIGMAALAIPMATMSTIAVVVVRDLRLCVVKVAKFGLAPRSVVLDTHPLSVWVLPHPTLTGASFRLETERFKWTLHSARRARRPIETMVDWTTPDEAPSHPAGGDDAV